MSKLVKESLSDKLKGPSKEEIDRKLNKMHPDVALVVAAEAGYLKGAKEAVEKGANVNYGNNSALRYATDEGQAEMAKYLLSIGANPRANNYDPVLSAIHSNDLETAKILLNEIEDDFPFDVQEDAYSMAKSSEMLKLINKYTE